MLLHTNGQSTAEYAIVIGMVIAIAAGVMQVALKSAITQKHREAVNQLLNTSVSGTGSAITAPTTQSFYTQDFRKTVVYGGDDNYKDTAVLKKGGAEAKKSMQTSETASVTIETLEPNS